LDVPRIPTDVAGRALLTHIALVYASRCAFQNRDARSACEPRNVQRGVRIDETERYCSILGQDNIIPAHRADSSFPIEQVATMLGPACSHPVGPQGQSTFPFTLHAGICSMSRDDIVNSARPATSVGILGTSKGGFVLTRQSDIAVSSDKIRPGVRVAMCVSESRCEIRL
jgi:hypothetical protein